ncbi:hypothetical protein ACVIAJ_06840 [Acinetobacter johnsonii]|uniref:Uncharacterized protein n=1 Tax=Acinetobacter johnsonii TaxID=40214 RepID=A0A1R7Q996_ACIJO|nr:hypothetical protein [Acinetobacter johnsonii]SJX20806.1 hypothetical protein ACNJC6_00403 [Acinetobacter johnsonii]
MATTTQKFSEFISQDDEGNIRMRLGHSTYFEKGRHIYVVNKDGTEQLITLEVHSAKPWIRENFERERTYQRDRTMAVRLQKSLTRSYPKSYKRAKGSLFWA